MRFLSLLSIALVALTLSAQDRDACTSIMVGRRASTDGSVMTSHCCDSWYRTWMQVVPAQDYPRELPFVDQTWQQLQAADPTQAETFLNGYTADYFSAALVKWDELYRQYQRLLWAGY